MVGTAASILRNYNYILQIGLGDSDFLHVQTIVVTMFTIDDSTAIVSISYLTNYTLVHMVSC